MRKIIAKKAVTAALALTVFTGAIAPAVTEASGIIGNVLGSLASGVYAMSQVNSQIKQLDNDKRDELFQQLKQKNGVNKTYKANAQLNRIMGRLTKVIAKYDETVYNKPYNYFVNNDKSFNAFCTMGHNLSVNIGLFETLNYQEDEIAFVIGHELAHGTHNDPANGVKKQVGMQVLASIAASSVGGGDLANMGAAVVSNLGTAKGITMPMEKRADKDAFVYCSEAGYNVGAGAAIWQKIIDGTKDKKESMSTINQIFNPSDHPKHINRRNDYSKTITEYSNKWVTVNDENGEISVNKVKIGTPAAADGQSAQERAYMVAGEIAQVYHANGGVKANAYYSSGYVYLNNTPILTVTSGDDASNWVSNLQVANSKRKK